MAGFRRRVGSLGPEHLSPAQDAGTSYCQPRKLWKAHGPEHMSDRLPERLPSRVSEHVSHRMPDRMPHRM